jgi:hypothetical protein
MPRDHFSKVMSSPYFQSENYRKSKSGQTEIKIENFLLKIKNKIMRKKNV